MTTTNAPYYEIEVQNTHYLDRSAIKYEYVLVLHINDAVKFDEEIKLIYDNKSERVHMCKVYSMILKTYKSCICDIIINYL